MNAPTKNDVSAMADIMKALNGDKSAIQNSPANQVSTSNPADMAGISDAQRETNAMAKILGAMKTVETVSENVATTLYESAKTEKGFKLGAYEISKNDNELFDVIDNRLNDTLFENIKLRESASALAAYLNAGKKINSPEITKIISANAIFESFYYDAIQHKSTFNSAKKAKNRQKMNISEDRFGRAKSEAMAAKTKIKSLYESAMSRAKV